MSRTTDLIRMWGEDTQSDETLAWTGAKGGYFSVTPELGLKVVGKTAQDTLTGSNIANVSSDYNTYGGSATSTTVIANTNNNIISVLAAVVPGQSYILCVEATSSQNAEFRYFWYESNPTTDENIGTLTSIGGEYNSVMPYRQNLTAPENAKYIFIRLTNNNSVNQVTRVWLNIGDTDLGYEPYCGGIPAPNPEYPMPIRKVAAGTKVVCRGKNLFDVSQILPKSSYDIRLGSYWAKQLPLLKPNTTYTFHRWVSDISKINIEFTTVFIATELYDFYSPNGVTSLFSAYNEASGYKKVTFTTGDTGMFFLKCVGYLNEENVVENLKYCKFMVTEGDATDTDFELYRESCEITTPCDLYEGDIWYPITGVVERHMFTAHLSGEETYSYKANNGYRTTIWTPGLLNGVYPYCNYLRGVKDYTAYDNTVFSYFTNEYGSLGDSAIYFYFSSDLFVDENAVKEWVKQKYDKGEPVTVYGHRSSPVLEQYDPSPIFAPPGTVNVLQTPVEESATLSATMLVHR